MGLPTVDQLRAQFQPAQANKYELELPTKKGASITAVALNMLCDSVTSPGRNISTIELNSGTQMKKYPYTFIEDDVNMVFLETTDRLVKKYFDLWMQQIFNTERYRVGYKKEYAAEDIKIKHLTKDGEIAYTVTLYNAYPTTVNPIELSNADDSLMKISVTFVYDRYAIT